MGCNDVLKRGSDNYQNTTAYPDTVANYGGGGGSGDNVIENATCTAGTAVGDWVRMNGSTAQPAQADTFANSKVIGVVISKSAATTCNIQVTGFTTAIFGGLSVNSLYFLSTTTAGAMTTSAPTGSGEIVVSLGKPYSTTQFDIKVTTQLQRA